MKKLNIRNIEKGFWALLFILVGLIVIVLKAQFSPLPNSVHYYLGTILFILLFSLIIFFFTILVYYEVRKNSFRYLKILFYTSVIIYIFLLFYGRFISVWVGQPLFTSALILLITLIIMSLLTVFKKISYLKIFWELITLLILILISSLMIII